MYLTRQEVSLFFTILHSQKTVINELDSWRFESYNAGLQSILVYITSALFSFFFFLFPSEYDEVEASSF